MKSKTFKNNLILIILSFVFLFSIAFLKIPNSYANAAAYTATTFDGTFSSYSQTSTATKPYTLSQWSRITGSDAEGTTSGAINLNVTQFQTDYPDIQSTDTSEKNMLLIKSNSNTPTRAGYQNKTAITLNANSYNIIKVKVNTDIIGNNGASIYLTGLDQTYKIENIETAGTWQDYYFFVKTTTYKSAQVYLQLWLGSDPASNILSSGKVYFDNINLNVGCSKGSFLNTYESVLAGNKVSVDLTSSANIVPVANGDFETNTNWTLTNNSSLASSELTYYAGIFDPTSAASFGATTAPGRSWTKIESSEELNKKALVISIDEETPGYVSYQSDETTIKQHGYYRLSIYTKTADLVGGGATITLIPTNTSLSSGVKASIDTSSIGLSQCNGYYEYAFYIEGNPYRDSTFKIELALGSSTVDVSGVVAFDDISLEKIDYTSYSTYNGATNGTVFKLHNEPDTTNILNGAFNFSDSTAIVSYPTKPLNWSVTDNANGGIVNINSGKYPITAYTNPGPITGIGADENPATTENNVLYIPAGLNNYEEYTSSSFTLTAGKVYTISFYAKSQDLLNTEGGINARLQTTSGQAIATLNQKTTNGNWTKYTLYVESGLNDTTAQLVIGLGTKNTTVNQGCVFIDNVLVATSTTAVFTDKQTNASSTETVGSLKTNSFNALTSKTNDVYEATGFTGTETAENITAGIVDVSELGSSTPSLRDNATDNYVLMINNANDNTFEYTANSTYSLTEGSFYEISVWMKTVGIQSQTPDDTENNLLKGATFKINNTENLFKAVTTANAEENNGWEKFTYYVKATNSQTLKITLGLGVDIPTQGTVYFDDLTVTDILEATYNTTDATEHLIKSDVTGEEEEPEEPNNNSNIPVNYWILIPSLILAAVTILAVVVVYGKKIKFPKKNRVKPAQYDRTKSLNNDIVKRELAKVRDEKIKNINTKIQTLNATIDKNKSEYESNLAKEKSTSKKERLFSAYAKRRNALQKDMDKLNAALAYVTDPSNIADEENAIIKQREKEIQRDNRFATKTAKKNKK